MLSLCLVLMLSAASVSSESQVRETETWMPMKTTQTGDLEASGDSPNDFGFTDGEYNYDTDNEDDEDYSDFSGSGDGVTTMSPEPRTSAKPDMNDNKIPGLEYTVRPTINEMDIVKKNEILTRSNNLEDKNPSNVLMSHAGEDSILNKTEVLAALITAGAVCLVLAALLILLLIYRMKKKDEGSYDLGKKPIYKKAPTTEIYA